MRMGGTGNFVQVLNHSDKIRRLSDDHRGFSVDLCLKVFTIDRTTGCKTDFFNQNSQIFCVRADHLFVLRMEKTRNQHFWLSFESMGH